MKALLTSVAAFILLVPAQAQVPCGSPEITVTVTPQNPMPGELVQVTLTNGSKDDIQLVSSCSYQVVLAGADCTGDVVLNLGCGGVITPIPAGTSLTTPWDQLDNQGQQVPDGAYSFRILYFDSLFNPVNCCASVDIGVGSPGCFGIGCPCGNDDPSAGCANSTGAGGLLLGGGSHSVTADDLTLPATGVPPGNSGLYYMGDALVENPFFDGKQCALGATWRFLDSIQVTGPGGTMNFGPGIATSAQGLIAPGTTWHFHAWHRDVAAGPSPCGTGANLTNVYSVSFTL